MGPITATVTSTKSVGSTDALGDAKEFIVTYKITPPGGKWASSDNGTYAVTLRGAPIADLAGNTVAAGVISRFSVQIPNVLAGTSQTPSSLMAGATFGLKVAVEGNLGHVQTSFIGPVAICLANNPGEGTLDGTYDPKAILPSPYHVLALDAGIHGFGVKFNTAGKQSIMVVDTVKASITSTASVTVTASVPAGLVNEDLTTEGNWIGTYGIEGHDVIDDASRTAQMQISNASTGEVLSAVIRPHVPGAENNRFKRSARAKADPLRV